jgi:hypothetical protein
MQLAPGMKAEWFAMSPPPVPRRPVSQVFTQINQRYAETRLTFELFHVYNALFVEQRLCNPYLSRFPGFIFVYDPPSKTEYPRYRFPRNEVTPIGLVTNQFGWRGRQIELRKAPNTIRIAFVGASTTVNHHNFPFSYPELAGFFLDKWAQERFGVHVETINAGREGITSTDIAAVVRDELLPLEPDLVVYYEGSNQFNPASIIRWDKGPPSAPKLTDNDGPELGYFMERSALLRRVRNVRSGRLAEPEKPDYRVVWPSDVNEFDPPLNHPNLPVSLSTIIRDLDAVSSAVTAAQGELAVSSFFWLVYDGMLLESGRHAFLYKYLNEIFYPYRYRDMERLAAFENRVLKKYAADRRALFLDIAGTMPRDPDLFADAVHATYGGVRLHAWIAAQMLAPWLSERVRSGRLPRPFRSDLQSHPGFQQSERTLQFDCRPKISDATTPVMSGATTIAEVDLSSATAGTKETRVEPGPTLSVHISPNVRPHLYAARVPISAPVADGLNRPGGVLHLQAQLKVSGGDARIGLLSSDEAGFLTYQTVATTDGFVNFDVAFFGTSLGPLIVAAGATRPNEVRVELRDVRIVSVPAYTVGKSLPGLSDPLHPP